MNKTVNEMQMKTENRPVVQSGSVDMEHAEALPDVSRASTGKALLLGLLFACVLGGLFVLGYREHRQTQNLIAADLAEAVDKLIVNVVFPKRQTATSELVFPADVQAYQETAIYPRSNGYLKRFLVDIGDRVKEGDLLAEIDTPEVDAQLHQAEAAVVEAQATIEKSDKALNLAQITWKRYENAAVGAVSQQDRDERHAQLEQATADLSAAQANLKVAQAEVQRLQALEGFKRIIAPFSGTINSRNYDVGALLSPNNTGPGQELFSIRQTDVVRVFVRVPQKYATDIREGSPAELIVSNYPERVFMGKVTRTTGTIDASTRTLRVQVDVANPDQQLFSGMFGLVKFRLTAKRPVLLVPGSALVYNADGLSIALVRDGKAYFQKVGVGRDLGLEIEIVDGLAEQDLVIANPGQRIRSGVEVQIAQPATAPSATQPAAPSATQPASKAS